MAKSSAKGKTPQARKFGAAARAAHKACRSEPGSSLFKCIGREMKARLSKKSKKSKKRGKRK